MKTWLPSWMVTTSSVHSAWTTIGQPSGRIHRLHAAGTRSYRYWAPSTTRTRWVPVPWDHHFVKGRNQEIETPTKTHPVREKTTPEDCRNERRHACHCWPACKSMLAYFSIGTSSELVKKIPESTKFQDFDHASIWARWGVQKGQCDLKLASNAKITGKNRKILCWKCWFVFDAWPAPRHFPYHSTPQLHSQVTSSAQGYPIVSLGKMRLKNDAI